MFARRIIKPELLDHLSAEEARPNLADLVRINSRFGGHSVLRKTLELVVERQEYFTLLDIGSASGDAARFIQKSYPEARITCLDCHETNMEQAPHPKLLADAFQLPFGPGAFDYVLCSLFLHHFTDEQVVQLLMSFYAAAKKGLLVCDLERQVVPYLFLPATRMLFKWNSITVHDGKISVRASFRAGELLALAGRARIERADVRTHRPAFRLAMVAVK